MSSIRVAIIEIASSQLASYAPRTGQDETWVKVVDLPNKPLFRWSGTMWVPVTGSVILGMSAVAVVCPVDANEDILATIAVPAGLLGPNGYLRATTGWSMTNSANNKTLRLKLGATLIWSSVQTTVASLSQMSVIANRGAANSQVSPTQASLGGSTFGVSTGALSTAAIDTAAGTSVVVTGQKVTAGETLTLESYLIEAFPG